MAFEFKVVAALLIVSGSLGRPSSHYTPVATLVSEPLAASIARFKLSICHACSIIY